MPKFSRVVEYLGMAKIKHSVPPEPTPVHIDVPPRLPEETKVKMSTADGEVSGFIGANRLPASELVRGFLKANNIKQKTVVLDPQDTWVNGIFVQTDKPLLGITYEYGDN